MPEDSVGELLHIFDKRGDVLRRICGGQFDKQTIEAAIEASRPTVDRAFRELEDAGILTSTGTAYELTNYGRLCCREFTRFEDRLETLADNGQVLSYLPEDAGIGRELLEGAAVHHADEQAPQDPLLELVAVVDGAEEILGYSSTINPYYVERFHALLVEEGTPATLAFTEDVVETGRRNYEKFAAILAAENTTVYETPTVLTYGLLVGDGTVGIPVGDKRERLRAVVVSDADAALAWADQLFERVTSPDGVREVS